MSFEGDCSFENVDSIISSGQLQAYQKYDSVLMIYNFFEKVLKSKGLNNEEESRMRILALKLFDRVFGEETTGLKDSTDHKSNWKRLGSGGWLRQVLNQNISNKTIELLIDLFSCGNFLIDSLERRKFSDFEMNLLLFPKKAKMLFFKEKEHEFVRSPNQVVYYKLLNSVKQHQNQVDKSQDWRITLQPIEYFIICLVRYPTVMDNIFMTNPYTINLNQGNRNSTLPTEKSVVHTLRSRLGSQAWVSRVPFLRILMKHIEHFIPLSDPSSSSPLKAVDGRIAFKKLSEKGDFFARMATEFWMDGNVLIIRREHVQARRQKLMKAGHNPSLLSHPPPTEIILLDNSVNLPFTNTVQCMYLLVERLLKEPSLVMEYSKLMSYNSELHSREEPLSCPPCINFIQQPLFDMIRLIFSRVQSISQENFSLVVELWLLYLQPWVLEKAKYSSKWEPYVASNFHFYTTIFGCYLQAVSQQDLLTVEDSLNFETFIKVLDVFKEKSLNDTLRKFTESFLFWYKSRNQNLQLRQTPKVDDVNIDLMLLIRNQHHFLFPDPKIDNLENYGILNYKEKLQKGKDDTKSQTHNAAAQILTKIHNRLLFLAPQEGNRQSHLGEIADVVTDIGMKLVDFISTPQKNSGGPRREELLSCQENLANILGIDKDINDYQHSQDSNTKKNDKSDDRKCCGDKLSPRTRHEIIEGTIKCNIDNYVYRHDSLISPIRSDEFDILVRYLIRISLWLNEKYDLPKVKVIHEMETVKLSHKKLFWEIIRTRSISIIFNSFRFNLRPLARLSKLSMMFSFILISLYWHYSSSIIVNFLVNLLMISIITLY